MKLRVCNEKDSEAISNIYNYYVENTIATFEEEVVSSEEFRQRIAAVVEKSAWFVCEDSGIVGYAYAGNWHPRSAYRFSLETTVYVHPDANGRGYGNALYTRLLSELELAGCHSAIAGISLPNDASIRLHEKYGFEKVSHFKEVGFKFGQWIDVGHWQKLFPHSARELSIPKTSSR